MKVRVSSSFYYQGNELRLDFFKASDPIVQFGY